MATLLPLLMKTLHRGRSFIRLQVLLAVCIAYVSTVVCQSGFLSIDCGAQESYYANDTGILWSTDADYTSTGRIVNNITVKSVDPIPNRGQVGTARVFDEERLRDCYELPVQTGETYLVRGTYFYGSLGNGSTQVALYVAMDNNLVSSLVLNAGYQLYESYQFEIIYSAPRDTLNLCLIRYQGYTFMSALELRKLAPRMYETVVGPTYFNYLYLKTRINGGAFQSSETKVWRYPDDKSDRYWSLFGVNDNGTHISNMNISDGASDSFADAPDRPPLVVMQDAWTSYKRNSMWFSAPFPSPAGKIYTAAYFQELDGNASATNVRGIDFYLNNQFIQTFNSSDEPFEVYTTNIFQETFVNISLVQADWSRLPPILNAYELHFVYKYNVSTTADEDVKAIYALQVRLNLTDWNGDPCLPAGYPYGWLSCNDDVFPRITGLFLGNLGIGGSIPLEIVNLTALTYLDLSNNSFNGSIPDISSLVHLEAIYLQDNDLGGEIPGYFGKAFTNLTQLNVQNNNLSGTVPPDLNRPGLNFTFSDNPDLINIVPSSSAENSGNSHKTSIGAVVGGILGGLVGLVVIAWIIWMRCTKKRRARSSIIKAIGNAEARANEQGPSSLSRKALAGSMTLLTLQEVSDATKKFSKKIGEGSFGPVYYGKLPNGQEVAVKVKSTESRQGATEFLNEVDLLSRIHHRNLVSLVGFCEEGNQQILIYVYVSNGTLRDHLYGDNSKKSLDWRTRLDIALNSARGLEYLHTDCNPRIIHRDVKSSNILIDEKMIAKVADFGISKQAPEGIFSGVDTLLKGTPGYFDPEYFISQRLTQKSDVYSFGVVLLEIISGRHPHVSELPDGSYGTLVQWVRALGANDERIMDIVDPSLQENFNEESMLKVISLAIRSIDLVTAKRPDMGQVVRALTEAIELELFDELVVKKDHDIDAPVESRTRNFGSMADVGSIATITEDNDEEDQSDMTFNSGTNVPLVDSAASIVLPR